MDIQTTQPANSDIDEHDKLMAQAYADDNSEALDLLDTPSSATQDDENAGIADTSTRAAASDKEQTPDNSEPPADGKPRDASGKFVKPVDKTGSSEQVAAPPEAAQTKEQKEADRRDRSWKALEQEKTEIRQLKDELGKLRQDLVTHRNRPVDESPKFDSKQYERASYEFAKRAHNLLDQGDIDGAKEQFALADQTRIAAHESSQNETQQSERQFISQWQENASRVIREVPELGDGNSEQAKGMCELLRQFPILGFIPDGFKHGYEILKLRQDAAGASELREENATLKQENARLTKLTSPAGGSDAAKHSGNRSADDMSLPELHARLEREAELADAAYR